MAKGLNVVARHASSVAKRPRTAPSMQAQSCTSKLIVPCVWHFTQGLFAKLSSSSTSYTSFSDLCVLCIACLNGWQHARASAWTAFTVFISRYCMHFLLTDSMNPGSFQSLRNAGLATSMGYVVQ